MYHCSVLYVFVSDCLLLSTSEVDVEREVSVEKNKNKKLIKTKMKKTDKGDLEIYHMNVEIKD